MSLIFLLLHGAASVSFAGEPAAFAVENQTLSRWRDLAFQHLECREAFDSSTRESTTALISWVEFNALLTEFHSSALRPLLDATAWPLDGVDGAQRAERLRSHGELMPYVARVHLPVGSSVVLFGDLHGALWSLLRELDALVRLGMLDDDLTLASNHFIVTLGDYVDRGPHGVEVLSLLLIIGLRNPGRVFQVRGNHEDLGWLPTDGLTFVAELHAKFAEVPLDELIATVSRVYDVLPPAVFLGVASGAREGEGDADGDPQSVGACRRHHPHRHGAGLAGAAAGSSTAAPCVAGHLMCVHGGIEVGFDAGPLLASRAVGSGGGSGGARVHYALVRGLRRLDWLKSPDSAAARAAIPARLHSLFRNYGARSQRAAASEALVGAHGPSTALDDVAGTEETAAPYGPYPVQPTATTPFLGWMWGDFYVDAAATMSYRDGRGLIWGRTLTLDWLARSGIVGIARAHQHNDNRESGPMMSAVRAGVGVHESWRNGSVLTWLSGAYIPRMAFPLDAFGVLRLPSRDSRSWRIERCGQPVQPHYVRRGGSNRWSLAPAAGDRQIAASADASLPFESWRPTVSRVCNPSVTAMQCTELSWRALQLDATGAGATANISDDDVLAVWIEG